MGKLNPPDQRRLAGVWRFLSAFFRFLVIALLILSSQVNLSPVQAAPLASTIHVAPTGSNNTTCGSPESLCRTIQYAVEKAISGDTILVAQGTYTYSGIANPATCANYSTSSYLPVICIVDKYLTIRGGFTTSNWINPNPNPALTVIDGQNQHRGIAAQSTSAIVDRTGLTLENFTIQNGVAVGGISGTDFYISAYGGGMFTDSAFTLRNVVFKNNKTYGGNTLQNYGGVGVGAGFAASMPKVRNGVMENVWFENNQAYGGSGKVRGGNAFGGGFYTWGALVQAENITLKNNLARGGNSTGSGYYGNIHADAMGGGAAIHGLSQVTIHYLTASDNQVIGGDAGSAAGSEAGHGFGGAIFTELASKLNINDANIRDNLALGGSAYKGGMGSGGGLMSTGSQVALERVNIIHNTARGGSGSATRGAVGGGGLYLTKFDTGNLTVSIANSVVADNYIEMGSGPGNPGGGGGGFWIQGVTVYIHHTTIDNNRMATDLGFGSAMILVNFSTPAPSNVTLSHSMITNHSNPSNPSQSAIHVWTGNKIRLERGLFSSNSNDTNLENDPPSGTGPGVIEGISSMIYASSPGYMSPGAPHYNYHLKINSPAINQAGESSILMDFDVNNRPFSVIADIGADEYHPYLLSAFPFTNRSLMLDWSKNAEWLAGGVSTYKICYGNSPQERDACRFTIDNLTTTRQIITSLNNGVQYYFVVHAKDASGSVIAQSTYANAAPVANFIYLPAITQ